MTIGNVGDDGELDFSETFYVPQSYYDSLKSSRKPRRGDILYTVTGSYGKTAIVPAAASFCFQRHIALLRPAANILSEYLNALLCSRAMIQQGHAAATGVAQKTVSLGALRQFNLPLPPIETQRAIIAMIAAEQAIVAGNRDLIARFEKKIEESLARVWGETADDVNEESEVLDETLA